MGGKGEVHIKKLLVIALALVMTLGLAACTGKAGKLKGSTAGKSDALKSESTPRHRKHGKHRHKPYKVDDLELPKRYSDL
ncbi:MAG: hypothetical protein RR827_02040 [Oscillospiraceae bacterium]